MGSRTYFDCAEDDYRGFLKNYEINNIYNSLGSINDEGKSEVSV